MTVMTETIGAEIALRLALKEVVKHISDPVLDSRLKALEAEGSSIEDADMKKGYMRALISVQRDQK